MSDERPTGAILRFHDATFASGARVIKAHERQRWVELEQLRHEADVRIEQEVMRGVAAAIEELDRQGGEVLAQCACKLAEVFARAAGDLERGALDLAFQIASRVIDAGPPEAFFVRAAEHLQTLVPQGSALCIRVHPESTGALAPFSERLLANGVRHLSVVADSALPHRHSLIVETSEGDIDLGCGTQLRRLAEEVARAQGSGRASGGEDAQ